MQPIALLLTIFVLSTLLTTSTADDGTIWAVLVAGSNGWENYRHQADVCHAWHTLVDHGVDPEHIVTMMYDDIAYNKENDYPGKIFNSPAKKDVYHDVRIDYKGGDVTPAVLTGDSTSVGGKRVLKSGQNDKVLIYFSDHGGSGVICFPDTDATDVVLTNNDLTKTLQKMNAQKMYKELTFYLEACFSGSMFDQKILQDLNIYAVTAANGAESSYGTYCVLDGDNCYGDLFSINWLEDSDKHLDLHKETLLQQFDLVKNLTTESHVQKFGNFIMMKEDVSEFEGQLIASSAQDEEEYSPQNFPMYSSLELPLRAEKTEEGRKALLEKRAYLDEQMERFAEIAVKKLTRKSPKQQFLLKSSLLREYPAQITQKECHHEVVHAFSKHCFNFAKNPYALKYTNVLANLCEFGHSAERIVPILEEHCANVKHFPEGIH